MAQDTFQSRILVIKRLLDQAEEAAQQNKVLEQDEAFDRSLWGAEVELKGALDRVGKVVADEFRDAPTRRELRRITIPIAKL